MYWFYVQEKEYVFQPCSGVFITLLEMLWLILTSYANIPAYQNSAINTEDLNKNLQQKCTFHSNGQKVENWHACILNNAIYCNNKIKHISDMPLKCNFRHRKHAIRTYIIWNVELIWKVIWKKRSSWFFKKLTEFIWHACTVCPLLDLTLK